ncbi:alkylated DNA repair protein alkB homolog 8-like [Montipora foliosa]|uniref:alkylated DNA repair protein alkB homolog 8-like n=1 Tax=Montipora foliosa TaxID=591990 RepID=UPI0035F15417
MATSNGVKSCATKLSKAEKKALRKQTKMITCLRRKNGELATVSETPTCHLMIGNGGLMCGVERSQLVTLFEKFGNIQRILMFPGQSFSFISFKAVSESVKAMDTIHGRLLDCPSEFPRPETRFYLSFLVGVPDDVTVEKPVKPDGLILVEDFLNHAEEEELIQALGWVNDGSENGIEGTANKQLRHRRVKHFGFEFLYGTNNVDKSNPLTDGIPSVCDSVVERLQQYVPFKPDQMTVNEYKPGQGIPPHIDTHSAFEDGITSISLGSQVTMEFRHPDGRHLSMVLPRRSLLVMTGESRYLWSHGITPRKYDIVHNTTTSTLKERAYKGEREKEPEVSSQESTSTEGTTLFERQTRISLTLRKIRHSPCKCAFASQCDSQAYDTSAPQVPPSSDVPQSEGEAEKLEKIHVHKVYESIASHFSGTRHSPWPRIADFLQDQPVGSIVADVGCGNGKYLGINDNIFKTGSDRSFNLAAICRERGFAVIVCDILSLPYRSDAFDVSLCIAVLHHLSTAERRLEGLRELVRITRPGGQVLVYVWALEQEVKKVKRSNLKELDFAGINGRESMKHNGKDKEESWKEGEEDEHFPDGKVNIPSKSKYANDHLKSRLCVNANRDLFEQQDLFVPWKYSGQGKQQKNQGKLNEDNNDVAKGQVFHRYYHVFQDGELRDLCNQLDDVLIEKHYYDKGNWCVVLKKTKKTP